MKKAITIRIEKATAIPTAEVAKQAVDLFRLISIYGNQKTKGASKLISRIQP